MILLVNILNIQIEFLILGVWIFSNSRRGNRFKILNADLVLGQKRVARAASIRRCLFPPSLSTGSGP
jgi:hypothetical protein